MEMRFHTGVGPVLEPVRQDRGKFQILLQTRIPLVHCVGQPRGSPESFPDVAKTEERMGAKKARKEKKVAARGGVALVYRDLSRGAASHQLKSLAVDPPPQLLPQSGEVSLNEDIQI